MVALLQSFLFRLCNRYSVVIRTNHPTLPLQSPGVTIRTARFNTKNLPFCPHNVFTCVCRHRINRLVFLVEANYVLCEVLVEYLPVISIRLNFQMA